MFNQANNNPIDLVEPIARQTARQYISNIPYLDIDDVVGEIRIALLSAIMQSPHPFSLKKVAMRKAVDLMRKARHRNHLYLDQAIAEAEDGDELTLGEFLENSGIPDLTAQSAEREYIQLEGIQQINQLISPRAIKIGLRRLSNLSTTHADDSYLSSYRKTFSKDRRAELLAYFSS